MKIQLSTMTVQVDLLVAVGNYIINDVSVLYKRLQYD